MAQSIPAQRWPSAPASTHCGGVLAKGWAMPPGDLLRPFLSYRGQKYLQGFGIGPEQDTGRGCLKPWRYPGRKNLSSLTRHPFEPTRNRTVVAVVKKNALGRSRGGLGTKIHAAVSETGHPVRLALSRGNLHDSRGAQPLLIGVKSKWCLANTAYDSNRFRCWLRTRGIHPVIPSHPIRSRPIRLNRRVYRKRFRIECFFHRVKRWRRVATRFEKRGLMFLSMVQIACVASSDY